METAAHVLATGAWTEPAPHAAASAFGLALAAGEHEAWSTTPSAVWRAELAPDADLTEHLVSARYRIAHNGASCSVELADVGDLDIPTGATVVLRPGYRSGPQGAPEFGGFPEFTITQVVRKTAGGRRTVSLEGVGQLEMLARWHAPQAWQTPPGALLRLQLAARIVARAGYGFTSGIVDPIRWNEQPSFALAVGESAASALARIAAATPEGFASAESASLTVRGFAPDDEPVLAFGGDGHPITELTHRDEMPGANWIRVQSADRYAEDADFASVYQHGAVLRALRIMEATTDQRATGAAAAARRRQEWSTPRATLVAPFRPGLQLFDPVDVEGVTLRVIAHGMEYRRGPAGARFDSILTLGRP